MQRSSCAILKSWPQRATCPGVKERGWPAYTLCLELQGS